MEQNNKNITFHTPTEEEMKEAHESYMKFLRENPNNFSYWFPKLATVKQFELVVNRLLNPKYNNVEFIYLDELQDSDPIVNAVTVKLDQNILWVDDLITLSNFFKYSLQYVGHRGNSYHLNFWFNESDIL